MDDFLSSMTFASGDITCDCDECGLPDSVPPTIRNAVNEHLRKRKLEQQPSVFVSNGGPSSSSNNNKRAYYNIQQNRTLIKRECGFAIWKFDMPCCSKNIGSDPLVEYRNQHRIIFVKQLDKKKSDVLSIGRGIIGSASEENGRKRVNWTEGSSYLLPASKGIACGWIHKPTASTDNGSTAGTDYIKTDTQTNGSINTDAKEETHGDVKTEIGLATDNNNLTTDTDNSDGQKNGSNTAATNNTKEDSAATTTENNLASSTTIMEEVKDVIIYVLKVSPETLDNMNKNTSDDGNHLPCWVKESYKLLLQCLNNETQANERQHNIDMKNGITDDGREKNDLEGIPLSDDECVTMNLIVELVQ